MRLRICVAVRYILVLLVTSSVLAGCGGGGGSSPGNNGSPPEQPTGKEIAREAVGSDGGTISADRFTLNVPAKAFAEDTEIVISAVDDGFSDDQRLTSSIEIFGLPADFAEPLSLHFSLDAPPPAGARVALSVPSFSPSVGAETGGRLDFPDVIVDGNNISVLIEPPEVGEPASQQSAQRIQRNTHSEPHRIRVIATPFIGWLARQSDHFRIHFPLRADPLTDEAEAILAALEDAYDRFLQMGFDYTARTVWPVEVTFRSPAPDNAVEQSALGLFGASKLSREKNAIWFNADRVDLDTANATQQLRTTAGHEFFHFVQALYEPFLQFAQATSESPRYWFGEAAGAWAEHLFADDPAAYVSAVQTANAKLPYVGYSARTRGGASYGYGMTPFINFLLNENQGETFLVEVYEYFRDEVAEPIATIEAISSRSLRTAWSDFMRQYSYGGIYPQTHGTPFTRYSFSSEGDVEGSRDRIVLQPKDPSAPEGTPDPSRKDLSIDFSELGARAFWVEAQNLAPADDTTELVIEFPPFADSDLTIMAIPFNDNLAVLGVSRSGTLRIPKIREVLDRVKRIIVFATYSPEGAPHFFADSSKTITVKLVDNAFDFSQVVKADYTLRIGVAGTYFPDDNSGSVDTTRDIARVDSVMRDANSANQPCIRAPVPQANSRQTFIFRELEQQGGETQEAHQVAVIVDSESCLKAGNVTVSALFPNGAGGQTDFEISLGGALSSTTLVEAERISDTQLRYQISGTNLCSLIKDFSYDAQEADGDFGGDTPLCDGNSVLEVVLSH